MQIVVIAIFLCFIRVNTYAQSDRTTSIEGIIIFPVSDSIPQGVILVPVHPDAFTADMTGRWLYFQAMKWTQRELSWEITECKKERVIVEGVKNKGLSLLFPGMNDCYMTFGKIILRLDNVPDENLDFK